MLSCCPEELQSAQAAAPQKSPRALREWRHREEKRLRRHGSKQPRVRHLAKSAQTMAGAPPSRGQTLDEWHNRSRRRNWIRKRQHKLAFRQVRSQVQMESIRPEFAP